MRSTDRHPLEDPISATSEPTGSHRQAPDLENHLDGPPLGTKPETPRPGAARRHLRRLLGTVSDELTRFATHAICTAIVTATALWWQHR